MPQATDELRAEFPEDSRAALAENASSGRKAITICEDCGDECKHDAYVQLKLAEARKEWEAGR